MPANPMSTTSAERSRSSLWMWPTVAGAGALVVALASLQVRPAEGSLLGVLWRGDGDAASSLLQVMATSVMTATTLTFTLTVVALQLASQQFSPRLLREFAHDPVTKRVLAVLAATFVFATTALSGIRADDPVPTLTVSIGYALGVASLFAILVFITHLVRMLRVDTMMLVVHDETTDAISAFYPPYGDDGPFPEELDLDTARGTGICAARSGFVKRVDVERLVERAQVRDAVVRIEVRPGDHVVRGTPVATAWATGGAPLPLNRLDDLADDVRAAIDVGYERTLDQDTGFGFRQLEDIAVKAMSPSVNDPVTAAHAVGHMGDLLVRLTGCRLGPTLHLDDEGIGRAIVPDRDFRYYLDLSCGQLRRFAASEPSVLVALLRMLRDVAVAARDDEHRTEVRRAARLVAEQLVGDVLAEDAEAVTDMRDRVERALVGDLVGAFGDRSGETRSM